MPFTDTLDIDINESSRIPKYKQIVDSIIGKISHRKLLIGDKLPSINELSEQLYLSRDTVEKAYRQLKSQKVISSVKGKGYYISKNDLISKKNVLFVINKPSTYKMKIFKSFVETLGADGHVDLEIYHCNDVLFEKIIKKNIGGYDHYVIMLHFKDDQMKHASFTPTAQKALDVIPKHKLILLDNTKPNLEGSYGSVYQDFKEDIYEALKEGLERINKYEKLILVYPSKLVYPYPMRIVHGFHKFCVEHQFDFEVIETIYDDMELQNKDLYITIEEMDLVNLVRQIRSKKMKLGHDIGIISYNDTPLKDLLGITVISTDFQVMGETAAYMVMKNRHEKVKNVFNYIERNSV